MFGFLYKNFITKAFYNSLVLYKCPNNMSYFWNFGVLAALFLAIQLISGIFLTFYYKPIIYDAFNSVEYLIRDVNYGWVIRYMHTTGASFFFFLYICI